MARQHSITDMQERRTGILPLRGSERYAPSSAALHAVAEGLSLPRRRVVESIVFWVAERARAATGGAGVWWSEAVPFDGSSCATETGHTIQEVLQAREDALGLGVLVGEGRVQVSAELVAELPALAALHWAAVRSALGASDTLAACLAVVRELARRTERTQDAEWISLPREELASAVCWGQTRVTQALRELEECNLMERAAGNGLCVRLTPAAWGAQRPGSEMLRQRPTTGGAAPGAQPKPGSGVVLRLGGAELHLPPGQKYRLSFSDDGEPVIEIE